MHFKIFFSFIFLNLLISQSLLNRAIGEELTYGSARSYAMGSTHATSGNNSSLLRFNPSLLSTTLDTNPSFVDFQINLNAISERRSILVKDYFGDFLTYADYVNNVDMYNFLQGGFLSKVGNFTLGAAYLPLASFNYSYSEEVRGSADIEDGDVGLKDPLEGFHQFKSSGTLNNLSFGLSFSKLLNNLSQLHVGFSLNQTLNTKVKDIFRVDTLRSEFENLALVNNYSSNRNLDTKDVFLNFGISYMKKDYSFTFSMEQDLLIQTNNFSTYNFIDSLGIISYLDSSNTNFILDGINYYKPARYNLGLSYSPFDNSNLTVSAEIEYNKFYQTSHFEDSKSFKFGFEYILPSNVPIRSGIIYKQSNMSTLPDQSIISAGSGGTFKQIHYDYSVSYTFFDYYYPDLFVLDNENYDNFDQITDSKFNFMLGIKYLLK
tara:strand:+ start:2590 stop:3888 length:1299 start_codon:yes stop_codon:yes gene_type:complete